MDARHTIPVNASLEMRTSKKPGPANGRSSSRRGGGVNGKSSSTAIPLIIPTDKDILSGRGGRSNKHSGNRVFRRLIQHNKARYLAFADSKIKQSFLIKSIVFALRKDNVRFLKQGSGVGDAWEELTEIEAITKTGQALREKDKVPRSGTEGGKGEVESRETEDADSGEKEGTSKGEEKDERKEEEEITHDLFPEMFEHANEDNLLDQSIMSDLSSHDMGASPFAGHTAAPHMHDAKQDFHELSSSSTLSLPRLMWSLSVSRQNDSSCDQKWPNSIDQLETVVSGRTDALDSSSKRKKNAWMPPSHVFNTMVVQPSYDAGPRANHGHHGYHHPHQYTPIDPQSLMPSFGRVDSLSMACSAPKKLRVFNPHNFYGMEQSHAQQQHYKAAMAQFVLQGQQHPLSSPQLNASTSVLAEHHRPDLDRSITKEALDQLALGQPLQRCQGRAVSVPTLSASRPQFGQNMSTRSLFEENESDVSLIPSAAFLADFVHHQDTWGWGTNVARNERGTMTPIRKNTHETPLFEQQQQMETKTMLPQPPSFSSPLCSLENGFSFAPPPPALQTATTTVMSAGFLDALDTILNQESLFEDSLVDALTKNGQAPSVRPVDLRRTTTSAVFTQVLGDLFQK